MIKTNRRCVKMTKSNKVKDIFEILHNKNLIFLRTRAMASKMLIERGFEPLFYTSNINNLNKYLIRITYKMKVLHLLIAKCHIRI